MSNLLTKYEGSIAAGRAIEGGVWALALALAKDVQDNGGTPIEATKALAEAGVTSTSGEPYQKGWIADLVRVGTWAFERPEFQVYPVTRIKTAGAKYDWDEEAMLLTLQANGTFHEIGGTSSLGKADREKVRKELERLSAKDRAAIATDLVSQTEVKEAILRSDPIAREQHQALGGEIAHQSVKRSEERMKGQFPSHAASDAADEASAAAGHLANALAEVIQWNVTTEHDRLRRLASAMSRVERYTVDINEAIGRVTAT